MAGVFGRARRDWRLSGEMPRDGASDNGGVCTVYCTYCLAAGRVEAQTCVEQTRVAVDYGCTWSESGSRCNGSSNNMRGGCDG
jgi:hypothetical protein